MTKSNYFVFSFEVIDVTFRFRLPVGAVLEMTRVILTQLDPHFPFRILLQHENFADSVHFQNARFANSESGSLRRR